MIKEIGRLFLPNQSNRVPFCVCRFREMEKLKDITPLPSRAEEYDVLKTLGRGTYGHCYKVSKAFLGHKVASQARGLLAGQAQDTRHT